MRQELIGGLVLCLIGLGLLFVSPIKLWTITEKWKIQDDGQPSKKYAVLIRILGAVFAQAMHSVTLGICMGLLMGITFGLFDSDQEGNEDE